MTTKPAQQGDDNEEDKHKDSQNTDDSVHVRRDLAVVLVDAVPMLVLQLVVFFIVSKPDQTFIKTILVVSVVDVFHCAHMIALAESVALGHVVIAHRVVHVVLPETLTKWRFKGLHELVKRLGGDIANRVSGGCLVLQQPMSFAGEICCGHVEVVLEVVNYLSRCLVVLVETHRRVVGPSFWQGALPWGHSRGKEHGDNWCSCKQ